MAPSGPHSSGSVVYSLILHRGCGGISTLYIIKWLTEWFFHVILYSMNNRESMSIRASMSACINTLVNTLYGINNMISIRVISIVSICIINTACSSISTSTGENAISKWLYEGNYVVRGVNDAPDYGARLPNNVGDYDRFCKERPWTCR